MLCYHTDSFFFLTEENFIGLDRTPPGIHQLWQWWWTPTSLLLYHSNGVLSPRRPPSIPPRILSTFIPTALGGFNTSSGSADQTGKEERIMLRPHRAQHTSGTTNHQIKKNRQWDRKKRAAASLNEGIFSFRDRWTGRKVIGRELVIRLAWELPGSSAQVSTTGRKLMKKKICCGGSF